MGLGDNLYLQSVARHLVETTRSRIEVCTKWPDVFRPIAQYVTMSAFRRTAIDRVCHYTDGKTNPRTDQWQDCCARAGIAVPVDLRLDWEPVDRWNATRIRNRAPVVAVQLPRAPMDRTDGFGDELLPDCRTIQKAIDRIKIEGVRIVQIGAGVPRFTYTGIDIDLSNRTSVCDLLDIASAVDGFLGYVSFVVPLAESLRKPALMVWSRKGLTSKNDYVRTITPQKIFHRVATRAVMDDCTDADLDAAIRAFLGSAGIG